MNIKDRSILTSTFLKLNFLKLIFLNIILRAFIRDLIDFEIRKKTIQNMT